MPGLGFCCFSFAFLITRCWAQWPSSRENLLAVLSVRLLFSSLFENNFFYSPSLPLLHAHLRVKLLVFISFHLEVILPHSLCCSCLGRWVDLGWCWVGVGLTLGWCWVDVGLVLGWCWVDVGSMLGWRWVDIGLTLGWRWVDTGLTVFIYWLGSRTLLALVRAVPDFQWHRSRGFLGCYFFRGLICLSPGYWVSSGRLWSWVQPSENLANRKGEFQVNEGETLVPGPSLQADNTAI